MELSNLTPECKEYIDTWVSMVWLAYGRDWVAHHDMWDIKDLMNETTRNLMSMDEAVHRGLIKCEKRDSKTYYKAIGLI